MAKQVNWIDEKTASEKLGYRPRVLRAYCKSGKLSIAFSTVRGRKYHYSESDIISLQEKYSTKKAI